MVKYMNSILSKTDELVNEIRKSSDYEKYIELREIIKQDKQIMGLIDEIKKIQKQIVRDKQKKSDISNLEIDLQNKLEELEQNPIYVEFNYIQNDLNNMLQTIKNLIEKHINDITN